MNCHRQRVVPFGEGARGELKGDVNFLPARSGFEDLSSPPEDPGCGKRSERTILKSLQIKYIDLLSGHSVVTEFLTTTHYCKTTQ